MQCEYPRFARSVIVVVLGAGSFLSVTPTSSTNAPGSSEHSQSGSGTWSYCKCPEVSGLIDICFVTSKVGWALASTGQVLVSRDGGKTWTVIRTAGKGEDFRSIAFINERIGLAVGGGGYASDRDILPKCIRTDDGGQSWKEVLIDPNITTADGIFKVQWITDAKAFIIGSCIYRSDNTGLEWKVINKGAPASPFLGRLVSGERGWFVRSHKLVTTNDGGASIEKDDGALRAMIRAGDSGIGSVVAWSDKCLWIYGLSNEQALQTTDSGENWRAQGTLPTKNIQDVIFVSELVGWCASYDANKRESTFYRTDDGGNTWKSSQTLATRARRFFFLNSTQGWAAAGDAILRLE